MGGQRQVADCDSSDKEDISLGESQHILFDLGRGRLSFLVFGLFEAENLVDRSDDMSKDVIFGDDVRECSCAIQNHKLMKILIVPYNLINPIGNEIQVMI